MRLIVLGIAILLTCSLSAQQVTEEPAVTRMMENFIAFNKEHQTVRGWRVQILVTTDRRQMEQVRSRFKRLYPGYELHFTHENPYYHLKTGAFLTQQSARPVLQELRKDFPGAFLVAGEIELKEVLLYQ